MIEWLTHRTPPSGLLVEFYVVTKWNPSHGTPYECTSEEFDRWTASCEDYLQGVRKVERLFYRAHGLAPASAVSRFLRRSLMRLPGKHLRSYRARKRCEYRLGDLACRHHDIQRELLDRMLDTTGEEAEEIASETLPPLYRYRPPARRQTAAHRGRRKRRKRT